jgi:hypothetical protein
MTRRPPVPIPLVPLALVATDETAAAPRVRPDRIAQVRERIRRRYYERPDVQRALVEAMLVELAAP